MDITTTSFALQPEHELRIETEPGGSPTTVILRSGTAEIFGAHAGALAAVWQVAKQIATASLALFWQWMRPQPFGRTRLRLIRRTHAGAEIAVGQRVTLTGQKIAVFSWHGAQIDLEGKPAHACAPGDAF